MQQPPCDVKTKPLAKNGRGERRSVWIVLDGCEGLQLFWEDNSESLVTGERLTRLFNSLLVEPFLICSQPI